MRLSERGEPKNRVHGLHEGTLGYQLRGARDFKLTIACAEAPRLSATHLLIICRWMPEPRRQAALLRTVACYTHHMSKRLQVLVPDQEMSEIQRLARRERISVGEWVRRALREARMQKPVRAPEAKLAAVRQSAKYSFPTADVDQMLEEIERGYRA